MTDAPAVFSECRQYRYLLQRKVGLTESVCLFIMLNPSTADEVNNDPTIRRCIRFAQDWGFGKLVICNIFAYRSTDPKALFDVANPVGPDNDDWILQAAKEANAIVVAWGVHGSRGGRSKEVMKLLQGFHVVCLGVTKGCEPLHPLYIPSSQELKLYLVGETWNP